jgi:hypothetical protein
MGLAQMPHRPVFDDLNEALRIGSAMRAVKVVGR